MAKVKPLLLRSGLTGTIWVATRYRDDGAGWATAINLGDVVAKVTGGRMAGSGS